MSNPNTPTKIIIYIRTGFIHDIITNSPVEVLVLDADTADDESPNIPGFGHVGYDLPAAEVQPVKLASAWAAVREAARNTMMEYDIH